MFQVKLMNSMSLSKLSMSSGSPSDSSVSSPVSSPITSPGTPPNLRQNITHPDAKWLVQKFGGTSIGKYAVDIAETIIPAYLDQNRVVIVCSARSGSTKASGTTSLLLRAADEAIRRNFQVPETPGSVTPSTASQIFGCPQAQDTSNSPPASPTINGRSRNNSSSHFGAPTSFSSFNSNCSSPPFAAIIDSLKSEHITAAKQSVNNSALLREIIGEIERDCEGLRAFLHAAMVIDEISPRSRDSIIAVGERLSCKLMATILRDRGIDSEFVCLENIIPENFEDTDRENTGTSKNLQVETLDQSFYDRLSVLVANRIKQCGNSIPVVTGFFGPVPGSLLRQVGRGYTDLLSALLAAGLQASELQIWKEVDGVFTADPRKVSTARLITTISPDEAAELTYYGSEIVHPFMMEQAIRNRIPIRIKNVENPNGRGTVIQPDGEGDAQTIDLEAMAQSGASLSDLQTAVLELEERERRKRLPTAVTIKENIMVLNVNSNRKSVSHGFLAGIFSTLDKFGVVVDLISTSEVHVSMAIEDGDLSKKVLTRLIKELEKAGTVSSSKDMAILSLVGHQMPHMVGTAGKMFSTLAEGKINIEMISQGASEINISCVIQARDANKALNLIHQSCLQIKPAAENTRGRGPWLF